MLAQGFHVMALEASQKEQSVCLLPHMALEASSRAFLSHRKPR